MTTPLVQSETFEEYMQTEHRPIRGGSPEADSPGGGEDQGAAAEVSDPGLYDLESVDPDIREHLTPHLKAIEGNVTKKLQEAAEFRKGWEPYEELGLRDIDPAQVKQLLEFAQMAQDPQQFAAWWKAVGEQQGLFEAPDTDDLDLEELDGMTPEKVQELVEKMVAERISPVESVLQEQQQAQAVEAVNDEISAALTKLEADNAALFEGDAEEKEQIREAIIRLAYPYSEGGDGMSVEDMIAKGFEDYQSFIARGEKGLFEKKNGTPPPPEGGGSTVATADDRPTSFDDPRLKEQVLTRLKQS